MKNYKKIMAQLTQEEQQKLFDILRKFNWILQKLENGEELNEREQIFLDYRPYRINSNLSVDLVDREVFFT